MCTYVPQPQWQIDLSSQLCLCSKNEKGNNNLKIQTIMFILNLFQDLKKNLDESE